MQDRRVFLKYVFGPIFTGAMLIGATGNENAELQARFSSTGVLRLEAKAYWLDAPFRVNRTYVNARGEGCGITILRPRPPFEGPLFTGDGQARGFFHLEGMSLQGTRGTKSDILRLNNLYNASVHNITVYGGKLGIRVAGIRSTIREVLVSGSEWGVYFDAMSNSSHLTDSHVQTCKTGVHMVNSTTSSKVGISHTTIENTEPDALGIVVNGPECKIDSCWVELQGANSLGVKIENGGKKWSIGDCHWSIASKRFISNKSRIPGRLLDDVPIEY